VSPTFASLKFWNYRLWFAGALVANVGTWMQRVAQDWLVLTDLTNESGFAVGVVTALQFIPMMLLSPIAGLLADRLPRRKLLIFTQSAMGVLAAALGTLVILDWAQLWHVYMFATMLGLITALDNPVRQTFVAEMVPEHRLANAVALNSASFNAARLVGPGIAGLLIAAVGTGPMFIINAASFGATIFSLVYMRQKELHVLPAVPRARGQIREGLRYIRTRSDLVVIMSIMGIVSALGLNFQLTSGLMAKVEFGKDAGEYGILGSILAIGSLGGALLAARRERPRVRLVVGAAFGFGVASLAMASMPTYETYAASSVFVGLFSLTMMTSANAAIQMSVAPEMRGRVMSIYMMVFLGSTPIGAPLVGWIGETLGPRWSIGVGAVASIVVAVVGAIWAMATWHVRVRYRLKATPRLQISHPWERKLAREATAQSMELEETRDKIAA